MTLREFIYEHGDDLLVDLPEEPQPEDFEYCHFVYSGWSPYGYREECGYDEEGYEEAYREWELECERIYDELEFYDGSDLYIFVDGSMIEDFDEMRAYLDRQVEKAEGYDVWIA